MLLVGRWLIKHLKRLRCVMLAHIKTLHTDDSMAENVDAKSLKSPKSFITV
jgi:hypothetical protein